MNPEALRGHLLDCLGGPWPDPCPLNLEVHEVVVEPDHERRLIRYQVEEGDTVSAYVLVPRGANPHAPGPAVAVWHQHNGQYHLGKSEPAGLSGDPTHHTGLALVREGYVVICPDALCFEDRQDPSGKLKGGSFERFEFLRLVLQGRSMAWKNILDMRRAVDVLVALPEVDEERLGCYGHSMGSTHTWLLGPWEPRLKALVGNCCLPTYEAIEKHHLLHCFPNFIPGWQTHGDTPDIAGLTAPRALHLNLGELDGGSPIQEARDGINRIRSAYESQDAGDRFSAFIEAGQGHVLSPAMWEKTREFFVRHLKTLP